MEDINLNKALENYIEFWEKLNLRAARLLHKHVFAGIIFTDPLGQMQGVEHVQYFLEQIMRDNKMLRIKVHGYGWHNNETKVYLNWSATHVSLDKKKQYTINGMSDILFGDTGLVLKHTNYWDTQSHILRHHKLSDWLNRRILGKIVS